MKLICRCLLLICIFLLYISFPVLSPLLLLFIPLSLYYFSKYNVFQLMIIFGSIIFAISILVFINNFFLTNIIILIIPALYFSIILSIDILFIRASITYKYPLIMTYFFIILFRMSFYTNTVIFPYYWTLPMHLLPAMNMLARYFLPVFFEALVIVLCIFIYLVSVKKKRRNIIFLS